MFKGTKYSRNLYLLYLRIKQVIMFLETLNYVFRKQFNESLVGVLNWNKTLKLIKCLLFIKNYN